MCKNFSFLSCTIFSTYLGGFFLIVPWGFLIKSVPSLWLNDFFFFLLGFGFSSIVRTRRHTSREVSGIGEISILISAKEKEKLKFNKTCWDPNRGPWTIGGQLRNQKSRAHFLTPYIQTEILNWIDRCHWQEKPLHCALFLSATVVIVVFTLVNLVVKWLYRVFH